MQISASHALLYVHSRTWRIQLCSYQPSNQFRKSLRPASVHIIPCMPTAPQPLHPVQPGMTVAWSPPSCMPLQVHRTTLAPILQFTASCLADAYHTACCRCKQCCPPHAHPATVLHHPVCVHQVAVVHFSPCPPLKEYHIASHPAATVVPESSAAMRLPSCRQQTTQLYCQQAPSSQPLHVYCQQQAACSQPHGVP
jgi:hypothetical protein